MISRLSPSDPFPGNLHELEEPEVEVLNSKLHRESDYEYAHDGELSLETEMRLEEVTEELDRRDAIAGQTLRLPAEQLADTANDAGAAAAQ